MGGLCSKKKPPPEDGPLLDADAPALEVKRSTKHLTTVGSSLSVDTVQSESPLESDAATDSEKLILLPTPQSAFVEKKVVSVGLPTARRRFTKRRIKQHYETKILSRSLNDRNIHYTSSLVRRHVEFANKSACCCRDLSPDTTGDPC